jgi:hypothetical protein
LGSCAPICDYHGACVRQAREEGKDATYLAERAVMTAVVASSIVRGRVDVYRPLLIEAEDLLVRGHCVVIIARFGVDELGS